jgi:hypothetical protein
LDKSTYYFFTFQKVQIKNRFVHREGCEVPEVVSLQNSSDRKYLIPFSNTTDNEHHRSKRASNVNCRLITVADYKFYQSMGNSNKYTTANYMVNGLH